MRGMIVAGCLVVVGCGPVQDVKASASAAPEAEVAAMTATADEILSESTSEPVVTEEAAPVAAVENGEPEFVTSRVHIDNVRQPHSLFDVAGQCMNNPQCAQSVRGLAAAYGIPLEDVETASATLSTSQNGEGSYTTIRLPANYQYCRAEMTMVSIVPRDGDRGSLFLGQARPDGVYYETWTPVQSFGGGRSWVEAHMTVIGVRKDIAAREYVSGRCVSGEPARAFFYCRGGGCINTPDRGQSVDTSSPPGASSSK